VYIFKRRLAEFNFYRFLHYTVVFIIVSFYWSVIGVYFCDDVSGFYTFVSKIDWLIE